jgi:DNA-binding IclR family transcriptional regulator
MRPESPVQSVDRALELLEVLAQKGEAGVTELALAIDVHKSTASRLIQALDKRGLVQQIGERGRYRLGLGILKLAGAASAKNDAISLAKPIAQELATKVGETVNLAVLTGNEVLYVDQVAGPSALSMRAWVGQRVPAHCTATGKILTAWLTEKDRRIALPKNLTKFTENTITSFQDLESELQKVRKNGFAVALEEMESGLIAIAAPVRNSQNEVIAALVVSGPAFRITKNRIQEISKAVITAADKISYNVGAA